MIYRLKRAVRSMRRGYRAAFGPITPRESWLAAVENVAIVHESIMFNEQDPDEASFVVGRGCYFEPQVSVWLSGHANANSRIKLGERVFVGRYTYLGAYQPITIGQNSLIGSNCYIISGHHGFDRRDIPICEQGFTGAAIEIGSDVWLGTRVTVLPGVTIGNGAIVGAGSVVTKSIPAFEIWAGVPAKYLRSRPGGGDPTDSAKTV